MLLIKIHSDTETKTKQYINENEGTLLTYKAKRKHQKTEKWKMWFSKATSNMRNWDLNIKWGVDFIYIIWEIYIKTIAIVPHFHSSGY